ncbi:hypothetical protein QL989_02830 [Pseudoalteromonas sp. APC 3224]|uniref:hypothetical protein n=1 Tax=Pseudoalteromonas sp. APC 3224 TaxID=3035203 RepID=UPI0025B42C90|nr:hypothetical protein [Pseudoalteromonas sp. APC 3224]MDN3484276.1 hypothetical protein [Pseudoalteromonas sp. APC 3224]
MKNDIPKKRTAQSIVRLVLQILVHAMAIILFSSGVMGLFLTPGYEAGLISPEDQNHLRVFWAVPIIMSLGIHYGLYLFYHSKGSEEKEKSILLLRGIAIWMTIAALVRVFSFVALGDPMPRLVPIIVESAFLPLLWFLSSSSDDKN